MSLLAEKGFDFDKSSINSVLYSIPLLFSKSDDTLPLWSLSDYAKGFLEQALHKSIPSSSFPDLYYYKGHDPRAWQAEAFEKWKKQGHRGVIEAVTATGKTTVGILAAADAVERGLDVLILVPGIELQTQWAISLSEQLSDEILIGKLGNGNQDTFESKHIIISTIHSARNKHIVFETDNALIIADEVHGYASEVSALALREEYDERLGLTATFERSDDGVAEILEPYFRPRLMNGSFAETVIHGCGYARGLADEILAPFRIGLVGIYLDEDEMDLYLYLDSEISKLRMALINAHNCPFEPFGEFMKAVTLLTEGNNGNPRGTKIARQYINVFNRRRELLANTQKKLESIQLLASILNFANKSLIFTQTIESANNVAEIVNQIGIPAAAFSSELKKEQRNNLLHSFKSGNIKVLAAPRVLDEGIDVPEADVGIIISASHSKRQMIQRMGRIIRPKKDKRPATFYIIYAKSTNEDPANGTHQTFLNEMYEHAMEVYEFSENPTATELLNWHTGH